MYVYVFHEKLFAAARRGRIYRNCRVLHCIFLASDRISSMFERWLVMSGNACWVICEDGEAHSHVTLKVALLNARSVLD